MRPVSELGRLQSFGYQRDRVTGTYFAQAREYGREEGRFISRDLVDGFADMPFSMNKYTYCFNNGMILVGLDGTWPSLSDIGKGISEAAKKTGKMIKTATQKVVDSARSIDWEKVGRTTLNVPETVGAVAADAIAVGTVGAIVGTGAASL